MTAPALPPNLAANGAEGIRALSRSGPIGAFAGLMLIMMSATLGSLVWAGLAHVRHQDETIDGLRVEIRSLTSEVISGRNAAMTSVLRGVAEGFRAECGGCYRSPRR